MKKESMPVVIFKTAINILFWSLMIWIVFNFFFQSFNINVYIAYRQALAVDLVYLLIREFLGGKRE